MTLSYASWMIWLVTREFTIRIVITPVRQTKARKKSASLVLLDIFITYNYQKRKKK